MVQNNETLWKEYRSKLFHFIRGRIADPETAEDITQDVFEKIIKHIDSLKAKDRLQSWLYQIARNAIIDHYRGRKRLAELPEDAPMSADPGDTALKELSACLVPMIDRLPPPYRESIVLSELEGKPHKDISSILGISLSGSKSRVQRGRALLKEMLTDCCRLEFDHSGRLSNYESKRKTCETC